MKISLITLLMLSLLLLSPLARTQATMETMTQIQGDNSNNLFERINPSLEYGIPGFPDLWTRGGYGTNSTSFNYPVEGSKGPGSKAMEIRIFNHVDGDAKLFPKDVEASGACYFQDRYKSNVTTRILVRFSSNGNDFSYAEIAVVPPSASWAIATGTFTVPADKKYVTIFHLIESNGSLTIDDFYLANANFQTRGMVSVTIDDGWISGYDTARDTLNNFEVPATYYIISQFLRKDDTTGDPQRMTIKQVLQLEAEGHEIGAHTRTHEDLTTLTTEQQKSEIEGSRDDLLKMGVKNVYTFAYPFGASNLASESIVMGNYFGARLVDPGFNNRGTNPYRLRVLNILFMTTPAEVIEAVKQCAKDKTWLIIVWHQVDKKGGAYSMTPKNFRKCIKYISGQDGTTIDAVTVEQGLYRLPTQ